jgi:hypothetical protein
LSTVSVAIVISGKSVNKFVSRIALAGEGGKEEKGMLLPC